MAASCYTSCKNIVLPDWSLCLYISIEHRTKKIYSQFSLGYKWLLYCEENGGYELFLNVINSMASTIYIAYIIAKTIYIV